MGTDGESPFCLDIVKAIAKVEGVKLGELGFTLHHHISTDAIELLVKDRKGTWELSFDVPNHEVTVQSDRTIMVDGDTVQTGR